MTRNLSSQRPSSAVALVAASFALSVAPLPAAAGPGALTQLPSLDGCQAEDGMLVSCTDANALNGARAVAASPDGKHVYVASGDSGSVSAFSRDKSTGVLLQLPGTTGCISETGTGGTCTDGVGLLFPSGIAVSKDGKNVYVASDTSSAVSVFSRDKTTGALTQLAGLDGCISETGSGGSCTDGKGLDAAVSVVVSNDGKNVYVGAQGDSSIAAFARDKTTGALTQLAGLDGCISETGSAGNCADGKGLDALLGIAISKDGKNVYGAAYGGDSVAVLSRDKSTGALTQLSGLDGCISETGSGGTCDNGRALAGAISVVVSNDGRHVYATSFSLDSVAVLARDKTTGALSQSAGTDGCAHAAGAGTCTDVTHLPGAWGITASADSRNVYVTTASTSVAAFARDKETGALSQLSGLDACNSESGSGGTCEDGVGLNSTQGITLTRDGKHAFAASGGSTDAVAIFSREK